MNDRIGDFVENITDGHLTDRDIFHDYEHSPNQESGRRLACKTQQQIADAIGQSQQSVADKIADLSEKGQLSDLTIFGDYDRDEMEKTGRLLHVLLPSKKTATAQCGGRWVSICL